MDILWSLIFIHYITFKLKNTYFFFFFMLFVLIWCRSGDIMVGQDDFSSPPDQLSWKVWETFVNSAMVMSGRSAHLATLFSWASLN